MQTKIVKLNGSLIQMTLIDGEWINVVIGTCDYRVAK